jgi:ABC-2 type transport system permease protein
MRNVWVIAEKELKSYFSSPIAYGLIAFFALLIGAIFWLTVVGIVEAGSQPSRGFPVNVNEMVLRPVIANMGVFSLFLIPMITMRLFAEEKRTGTFELLATSPVKDWEIVTGKWLASLFMYSMILIFSAINFVVIFMYSQPDWKPMAIALLGLVLQGGALLAVGTFLSSLTRNQIIAGISGFAVCLLLWIMAWLTEIKSDSLSQVINYISVIPHFEAFAKGLLNSMDVVYYVSMIVFWLFLTTRSLESIRWRG